MDMKLKLKETCQKKVDNLVEKYIQAELKYKEVKIKIIKQFVPNFEGTSNDFFDAHTIVSESRLTKKHYDTINNTFVDYDIVDETHNLGIIYDDIGKRFITNLN